MPWDVGAIMYFCRSDGHVALTSHGMITRPFNDAVRCKHDVVAAMMRRLDPNIAFKLGGNELGVLMCQAAFDARLDDIKRLVNNGVDPNEDDYDGRTGMHLAASGG